MSAAKAKPKTIAEYIAAAPRDVQPLLTKIRATIRKALPDAEESISYAIPAFKIDGRPVIYFAAFKSHIGIYPVTTPVKDKFKKDLAKYELGKGTLRLPLDEPIPYSLIARIAKYKALK